MFSIEKTQKVPNLRSSPGGMAVEAVEAVEGVEAAEAAEAAAAEAVAVDNLQFLANPDGPIRTSCEGASPEPESKTCGLVDAYGLARAGVARAEDLKFL